MDNNQYNGYGYQQPGTYDPQSAYDQQQAYQQQAYQQPYDQGGNYQQYPAQQNYNQAYQQPPYQQNPYGANPYGMNPQNGYYGAPVQDDSYGMGVASLVLGILSLVFVWAHFLDIPFIALGEVFGRKARKINPNNKLAIAGYVCSTIAAVIVLLIAVVYGILMIVAVATA